MEFLLVCCAEHLCGASKKTTKFVESGNLFKTHMNSLAFYLRDDAYTLFVRIYYENNIGI